MRRDAKQRVRRDAKQRGATRNSAARRETARRDLSRQFAHIREHFDGMPAHVRKMLTRVRIFSAWVARKRGPRRHSVVRTRLRRIPDTPCPWSADAFMRPQTPGSFAVWETLGASVAVLRVARALLNEHVAASAAHRVKVSQ